MGRFERYFLEHALKGVLCLFCAVLLYPQASFGQKLKSQIRHYSTADGLSHDGVLCMTRDREGFMWFGTWDGINRFDGSNFITYKARPGDRSSLRNNKIRNIIEDKKGYLWVKTYDNKVYRFDKSTEKFIAVTKTITGRNIEDIVIEKIIPGTAGETWLLTEAQGVLCVEQGAADTVLEVYAYNASGKDEFYLPSDKVNFLFEDSKGKIWVGTSAGLVCLEKRGGRFRQYLNFSSGKKSFGTNYTFKNAAEYNGHVYFGTDQGMLIEYNQQARLFKIKSITPGKPINALLASKQNRLYLSTNNSGLAILDLKTSVLSFKKMPGYSSFFSLYEDRTGNVWIEPPAAGVIKFDPGNEQFKLFVQKKPYKSINFIAI